MSVDRFRELKGLQGDRALGPEDVQLHIPGHPGLEVMGEFQQLSDRVKLLLEKVEVNSTRTKELEQRYSKATTSLVEKDVSEQLEAIISENTQLHQRIDKNMKEMRGIVDTDLQDYPEEPETRMKKQMLSCLAQKTKEVMLDSQATQTQFKDTLK